MDSCGFVKLGMKGCYVLSTRGIGREYEAKGKSMEGGRESFLVVSSCQ